MPDADPEGRAEYERALAVYDEANTALTDAPAARHRYSARGPRYQRQSAHRPNAKRLLEAQLATRDAPAAD